MQKETLVSIINDRVPKEEMLELIRDVDITLLLEIALSSEFPTNWRAAWLLQSLIKTSDELTADIMDQLISAVAGKTDGHQRELLKTIMLGKCSDDQEGRLFDLCTSIWESPSKQSSVRCLAFKIILQIAKKYPELITELQHLMQPHYLETLSPGIKRSIEKQYAQLSKTSR